MTPDLLPQPSPCFDKDALVVSATSKSQAYAIAQSQSCDLGLWAFRFKLAATLIYYPGCKKPIQIPTDSVIKDVKFMTQQLIYAPGFQIAPMAITPSIWQVLGEFLEFPDRKSGLIRVADNRQVALSRSFGSLVPDYTLEECVTRRREDYWYLPDLQDFAREARQRLEVNNPLSFFEFSWRGYDPGYINWERIVNRYRLVSDDNGTLYEVSTNIGCEPLTSPPPVFD